MRRKEKEARKIEQREKLGWNPVSSVGWLTL